MAKTKLKDLVVKVGSYTDRNSGQEKGRYESIGALMQSDDGSMFVMLKRTFNPAGVPGNADRDSILVSAFDPQPRDGQRREEPRRDERAPAGALDDEIPFAPSVL